MQTKKRSGTAIATAAALLFTAAMAGSSFAGEPAKMRCDGVNACKGQSACKTATSGCSGQNACKATGYLELTKKDCKIAKANMKKAMKDGKDMAKEKPKAM
jgi:hypothetical protein